jgi:hypothetical protein
MGGRREEYKGMKGIKEWRKRSETRGMERRRLPSMLLHPDDGGSKHL